MNTHLNQYRQQQGLSLVELMVALVLGMLLMTGIIQVFLSSKQTYAANEANARIQENGRFALDFISRSARLGGYTGPAFKGDLPGSILGFGCDGLPAYVTVPSDLCNLHGYSSPPGDATASIDKIAFIFQPPLVDGYQYDCAGNRLSGTNNLIINQFAIIPADNIAVPPIPAALGCRGYKLTANPTPADWTKTSAFQPIVEGIDRIQVLYGVTNTPGGDSVNQYISADRVTALNAWKDVLSVRISVLANSVVTTEATAAARQFVLLDAAPVTAADLGNDRRSRQIFTTTIQFKNIKPL